MRVTAEPTPWPRDAERPPRAAVSAFGVSAAPTPTSWWRDSPQRTAPSRAADLRSAWPSGPERRRCRSRAGAGDRGAVGRRRAAGGAGGTHAAAVEARRAVRRCASWPDAILHGSTNARRILPTPLSGASLLADMAWTAGVGRSHLAHRAAVVFRDADSLRDGLRALAEADEAREPPAVPDGGDSPQRDGASVAEAAAAYEAGLPVSFAGLFAGEARRRISLPAYPFQRRRHWIRMR